jgi:rod shape-determining protein MreC
MPPAGTNIIRVAIMASKRIKLPTPVLVTWFTLIGFFFLFAPQNLTNKFQFAFARIFRGPLNASRSFSLSTHSNQPLSGTVTRREYNRLQNYLANVTKELTQEREKIKKLSGIHDRRPLEGANLVFADIITASVNGEDDELIINRGTDDALEKGQFVLGDNSIIGTISAVTSRTAEVRLITNPASKIPVRIAQLDVERLMQGTAGDSARILLLPTKHKVHIDDVVYACKKPGFLDAPMIAGTVAQCKKGDENPLLWDITVRPACDVTKLTDVAVIILNPKR